MKIRKLGLRVLAIGLSVAALSGARTALSDKRETPECALALDWVRDNLNELPAALSALSALPVSYRRQVFNAVDARTKSSLMREHLSRQLLNPELSDTQKDLIREAIDVLTPDLYAVRGDDVLHGIKVGERLEPLRRRVTSTFQLAQYREVFVRIGPAEPTYRSFAGIEILLHQVLNLDLIPKAFAGDCNCTDWVDCGGNPGYDCYSGHLCAPTMFGCGFGWLDPCDGLCDF